MAWMVQVWVPVEAMVAPEVMDRMVHVMVAPVEE